MNRNFNIEKFTQERACLAEKYDRLAMIAKELNNASLAKQISDSKAMLLEDCFKLVVVGEFSRGKSTFINALIGQRILPAKTNPTTTIINRISYGSKVKYVLHYRNSDELKEISADEFKKIVAVEYDDTENADLEYEKAIQMVGEIAYAELRFPLSLCQGGVEIIDTPGTNDLDQAREEITLRFIPEADAAIMILSAEQILSRSELDFIKDRILKNDIQKIFFAVNFKDRLENTADGERICKLAIEHLKKIIPNPRVFLVSSKDALSRKRSDNGEEVKGKVVNDIEETGFPNIEQALASYLMTERSSAKLSKYYQRLTNLAHILVADSIVVRRNNLGHSVVQLEEQLQFMKPKIARARERSHVVFRHLQTTLSFITTDLTACYKRGLDYIARQAVMAVHNYNGPLDGEAIARALEAMTAPMQQEHDRKINYDINRQLTDSFADVQKKLKDIFKTEELSKHRELMVIENDGKYNMPVEVGAIDSNDVTLLGGGILLGAIVFAIQAPFIAIPVALFGGKYFLNKFEEYHRNDYLIKVAQQIRCRYSEIIPQQAEEFHMRLQKQFESLIHTIEEMIDHQITMGENQIEQMLEEKRKAAVNEENERKRLCSLEQDILRLIS